MAASSGRTLSDLIQRLLGETHRFSFYQAVRLLHRFLDQGGREEGQGIPLRIRPCLRLAFPAADLRSAVYDEDANSFEMEANFLGLYGCVSPLPTFYTEDLLDEQKEEETVTRDFLDIFNQRQYDLFYEILRKYRLCSPAVEQNQTPVLELLFALVGMEPQALRATAPHPLRLLRYVGLISQQPKSATGLTCLLRDVLDGAPVRIEQCVERTVPIPEEQRALLGSAPLGGDVYIGEDIEEATGSFRINIGPVGKATFDRLLPGSEDFANVVFLAAFYIVEAFDFDMSVQLNPDEVRPTVLGDPDWSRLGWNTWVFGGDYTGDAVVALSTQ